MAEPKELKETQAKLEKHNFFFIRSISARSSGTVERSLKRRGKPLKKKMMKKMKRGIRKPQQLQS